MSASDTRGAGPDIDYLTRDYRGLRDFMLALRGKNDSPWSEASAADIGVAVLEALAYRLDHIAYAGDRVASEAYVGTARSREAVRRHAALGDHALDRGSTSSGFQHFTVRQGALDLPARTTVGTRLGPADADDSRDTFQTTQQVSVDQRRNSFRLRKSLPAGAHLVWLSGARGEALDLWSLGLRPGMYLALTSRDHGEVAEVSRVQSSAVVLAEPCQNTYIAGGADRAAVVLANIAPVRRGQLTDWRLLANGGRSVDEGPMAEYFRRRIAVLADLAALVEHHRNHWSEHADLAHAWRAASRLIDLAVCRLRTTSAAAIPSELAARLVELLDEAEAHLRSIGEALSLKLPAALQRSRRVPMPDQLAQLPEEEAVLWMDDAQSLEVITINRGQVSAWVEVEDFLRSGPNDRHYVVEIEGPRRVAIRFGDGEEGSMPPPGVPILGRWVTGDPSLADVGHGALTRVLSDEVAHLDSAQPGLNPTATSGWRAPELLEKVSGRIRRELSLPATAITSSDLVSLLERDPRVAEAVVAEVLPSLVRAAVRLRPRERAVEVLPQIRGMLEGRRLVGTRIDVVIARPFFVSISAELKVHPEADPSATLDRCAANLMAFVNESRDRQLGAPLSRAEVHRIIEGTIGVTWAGLSSFTRADRSSLRPAEVIQPAGDQVIRCHNLPDNPAAGAIELLSIVEFSLQVELFFIDPDDRPDDEVLHAALLVALSGAGGVPRKARWSELSRELISDLLEDFVHDSPHFGLRLRALIYRDRAIERVLLRRREVPVVVSLQLIPRRVEVLQ